jgi:tetratricopeptide (TPR) repeat protein
MALSVHNSTFWHFLRASLLISSFSLSAFSQETSTTFEAAMATTEPAARREALQKFLQAQPEAPQADAARAELTRVYAYLGEMQLGEKNLDAAMQQFKQAIASLPKQLDNPFFDEVALKLPVAVSVRGYRTEAILLARELEARFSTEAKRLAAIGEFYLSLEAPTEALRALNTAVELTPDDARIYRLLGTAYRINLNLDKAAEQFTAAIKADAKDPRAYFELANLQRARGRYELAINLYNHQLGLEPEHAPSLKGLALCHLAQGKEERANELLTQAAQLTNTELTRDFYLQTQLALTYLARGKLAQARQAVDAALAAEPRFSWARIAAAEVELAEGKYFESERNIIAAMQYANFPTLHFTLGKIYLAVEDFEGALEEFGKAFSYKAGKFQTRLGGVQETSADTVAELLAPERQASMFQAEPITTDVEFKLAENLTRLEATLRGTKHSSSQLLSAIVMSQKTGKAASAEIEKAANDFVETEGSRKPFRWLYVAERLTQSGQALEAVLKLTDQALEVAEAATAPEGSMRDYPNYDRDGRLRVFRGRALTLRGRALIKLNRHEEAIFTLGQALESYGLTPEHKRAQWQLALAKESAGQTKEALDLYMTAYEPPDKDAGGSDLNRTVIEGLYRKVYGSLDGLNERIGKARETTVAANLNPIAPPKPTTVAPPPTTEKVEKTEQPVAPTETTAATTPPPTTEVATKPEPNATQLVAEVVTVAKPEPEAKPEPKAEVAVVTPIVLPEARIVTMPTSELVVAEVRQEMLVENEDAPPPAIAVAANTDKPADKIDQSAEAASTAAPVVLPETKSTALDLATAKLALAEFPRALPNEADAAPAAAKPAEATLTPEEPKPTTTAITLPEAAGTITLLLPTLQEVSPNAPELAGLGEVSDPAPPAEVSPQTEGKTKPRATSPRTIARTEDPARMQAPTGTTRASKKPELSDERVAELEKAISGSSPDTLVGKKGNSAAAVEEAASGHQEGDAPVRVSKEPLLPAGESGRIVPMTPKVNPSGELTPEGLPSEVETRAKAMGQSAGKLSAGAALEVEAPDKPAGQGRKGANNTEADSKAPTTTRPRRVKKDDPIAPPRNP